MMKESLDLVFMQQVSFKPLGDILSINLNSHLHNLSGVYKCIKYSVIMFDALKRRWKECKIKSNKL